jgi:hypothetical protein
VSLADDYLGARRADSIVFFFQTGQGVSLKARLLISDAVLWLPPLVQQQTTYIITLIGPWSDCLLAESADKNKVDQQTNHIVRHTVLRGKPFRS